MLSIRINIGGQSKMIDLHCLPVNGTFARKLLGPDLYKELKGLGVPDIPPL